MISHLSKIITINPVPPIFFPSIWLWTAPTSMGVVRPEPSQEAASVEAGLARHRNPTPMKNWLKKIDQTYARNLEESTATPATPHFKDPFHQGSLFQPFWPRRHLHPVAIPATAPHWKRFLAWKIWKNLPFNSASGAVRGQPLMTEAVTWKEASQKQVNRWIIAVCHRAWSHQPTSLCNNICCRFACFSAPTWHKTARKGSKGIASNVARPSPATKKKCVASFHAQCL